MQIFLSLKQSTISLNKYPFQTVHCTTIVYFCGATFPLTPYTPAYRCCIIVVAFLRLIQVSTFHCWMLGEVFLDLPVRISVLKRQAMKGYLQVLCVHNFLKELAGSTQSKQYQNELLYWDKLSKTSRITVLNIWKLYKAYAVANCHFS